MCSRYVRRMSIELTRLTVNLMPKAARALTDVAALNEETRTDAVNRAIQLYYIWSEVTADGGEFYIRRDGQMARIEML